MTKVLSFIGLAAIAIGIVFMVLGFVYGGTWVFLLAAQVALPAIISGIVFLAFGYVVELLEGIRSALIRADEARRADQKSKGAVTLRLEEIAGPVRALRSIGDSVGGVNDKQRTSIVDFIAYTHGAEFSLELRKELAAWVDMTTGVLDEDLDGLKQLSAPLLNRFRHTLGSVASNTGLTQGNSDRRAIAEAAAARVKAALPAPLPPG